jgi:hypothetical protein
MKLGHLAPAATKIGRRGPARATRMTVTVRRLGALITGATAAVAMLWSGAASSQAARVAAASLCSRVSSASVSAIVGYSVPPAKAITEDMKATPQNFDASAVATTCTYGVFTSELNIKKAVLLESDIESKTITAADLTAGFKSQEKTEHAIGFKIVPYSGLGVTAFYFTETASGIYFQGLAGVAGTHVFSAAVYSKTISESKLAALAKLAETL